MRRRGATILARNVRSGPGEIDLLVETEGRLVAIEVKTRAGGDPLLQLTAEKSRRLRASVSRLVPRPQRIDAVAVRLGSSGAEIRWLRGL